MGDDTTHHAIFTAASVDRQGARGGWAAILVQQGRHRILQGTAEASLDGLELLAMLAGLAVVPPAASVCLITRNDRLYRGLTVERERWRAADWYRPGGQPLAHRALWVRLDAACQGRSARCLRDGDRSGPSPLGRAQGLARAASGHGDRQRGTGPGVPGKARYSARPAGGRFRPVPGRGID
jgi:ribonuclease HI